MMNNLEVYKNVGGACLAALFTTALVATTYVVFEPVVSRAQTASDEFTVKQTIGAEISFFVAAADVTMVGSINGLTGGYATGTAYTVVKTNNVAGYNMTLKFNYATTSGMQGEATADVINNYTPVSAGVPDYGWVDNASGGAAEFGYTVTASSTADLDLTFQNNGTTCATAGVDTPYQCWLNGSTTAETIIQRSTAAPTGATTTIQFKVAVPSTPTPSLSADIYTATATLTAINN